MSVEDNVDNKDKRRVSSRGHGRRRLNGAIKYDHRDMRNVLERSSARDGGPRGGRCRRPAASAPLRH